MHVHVCAAVCMLVGGAPLVAQNFNGYPIMLQSMGQAVNSPHDDYAPALLDNGAAMFFTSTRPGGRGKTDAWLTRWTGGAWFEAVNVGESFNSEQSEGTMTFSTDGVTVMFASDALGDNYGKTDIYFARMQNGRPVQPVNPGPAINSSAWESHPALSPDGRMLVFASNRRGGYGRSDLWVSRKNVEGEWGRAFPLSGLVNTEGDELAPSFAQDGSTLYFASNGHDGYGGYDLWMTRLEDGDWRQPVNLGPTINSPRDDLFLASVPGGKVFYISSARAGGEGGLDILRGTPDVFGAGVRCVPVAVVDSVSRSPVTAMLVVRDVASGQRVDMLQMLSAISGRDVCVAAGREHALDVVKQGAVVASWKLPAAQTGRDTVRIAVRGAAAAQEKSEYDVPLFLEGSYRPNTTQGLEALLRDLDGPLRTYGAIRRPDRRGRLVEQYKSWALDVESLCRRLYVVTADRAFPDAVAAGGGRGRVEITVTGYPDPRPFIGVYADTTTTRFFDARGMERTVQRGDTLDGEALAGLRAGWAAELFDRLFDAGAQRGKAQYRQLQVAQRVVWRLRTDAESDPLTNISARRRVRVVIRLLESDGRGGEVLFDSHTDLAK